MVVETSARHHGTSGHTVAVKPVTQASARVGAAAVIAPIIVDLPPRLRLPAVVAETALGITLGPHLLGIVAPNPLLGLFGTLGLAFLFFIAGMELDFQRVRGRPIGMATIGWIASI